MQAQMKGVNALATLIFIAVLFAPVRMYGDMSQSPVRPVLITLSKGQEIKLHLEFIFGQIANGGSKMATYEGTGLSNIHKNDFFEVMTTAPIIDKDVKDIDFFNIRRK